MNQAAQTTTGTQMAESRKLIPRFAERYGVDADKLLATLRATAFRQDGDNFVSNEEMMALLVVADQYKLNPFTKEIFAFFDKKKGVIPIVSVDGWSRIINDHDEYDGIEFRYSENIVTPQDGKPCPEWCEAVIYRKDKTRPIIIREYLDEVYVGKRNGFTGPWQTHTKRMLRHKTLIQGGRVGFGFAGIYDEDEAGRIIDTVRVEVVADARTTGSTDELLAAVQERAQRTAEYREPMDADFTDAAAPEAEEEDAPEVRGEPVDEEEPDPVAVFEEIKGVTEDAQLEPLLHQIERVTDIEARKDLTRKLLAKKTELMRASGRT